MSVIAIMILVYFFFPAMLGYGIHIYETPKKRTIFAQQAREVRRWRAMEISVAVFMAVTSIFYGVGIALKFGVKFSVNAMLVLLVVNCLSGLVFLCIYCKIPQLIRKYNESIKLLMAPLAVLVVTLSKIMSDASIAELSGLSPQDLPGAQLLLTFILTPVIWLLGLSLAYGYLSLPLVIVLVLYILIQNYRQHRTLNKDNTKVGIPQFTLIVAVFLSSILALTVMGKVVSKNFYEPHLRQAIAFASFHLPTTFCGLPESEGVEVAPMPDDRAALAIPDPKQGYIFEAIDCKAQSKSSNEATTLLESRNRLMGPRTH